MKQNHTGWPAHARLFSGPDVWMESVALEQLAAVAALPGCIAAAGMPDLHPGRGYPIGAAVATRLHVYPHLIGGDAGCGARVAITRLARVSADWVERRIQSMWDTPLFDPTKSPGLFDAVWFNGVRGLADVEALPDALRAIAARETAEDSLPISADPARFRLGFDHALGTIGGGNHFAEVSRISEIVPNASPSLQLTRNSLAVLVHSGSRGLGAALAKAWGQSAIEAHALPTYLGELAGACRFARANRFLLTYRLLAALGALRDSALGGTFDVTHNDVRSEVVGGEPTWVHRKGAAPAYANAFTVVLGSRGAPSWIMQGTGNQAALQSVAHGAGRKMARGEARDKLRARYKRSEITRSASGGRLLCEDQDLLFEEHPDAYKPIEPVIAALETHGMATRVAALTPVVTVKL